MVNERTRQRRRRLTVLLLPAALLGNGTVASAVDGYATTMNGQYGLTVRSLADQSMIVLPSSTPLLEYCGCTRRVELSAVDNGFDLRIHFTNPGAAAAPFGWTTVGAFKLGRVIRCYDTRRGAHQISLDSASLVDPTFGGTWPGVLYSPVMVIGNERVTAGVSVLYPFEEYKNKIEVKARPMPNGDGTRWEVRVCIDGALDPGQERDYVFAVRFQPASDPAWVRTLIPYRDYFRATYGGVEYTRDPRPVSGIIISSNEPRSADNPRGFACQAAWRPDLQGWGPLAAYFRTRPDRNYSRLMVWTPSGVYPLPEENPPFPFRFMTGVNDVPRMRDSLDQLRAVPGTRLEVGYWWGNCCQVDTGWGTGTLHTLNPNNPDDVARAFAEVDMAVSLNATIIGLDAFGYNMSPWDAYTWLKMLKRHAPSVKFVTENALPDVMHRLAPTFVYSADVHGPPVLADFLLPGHELWATVGYWDLRHAFGRDPTEAERYDFIGHVASQGYVPVVFEDLSLNGRNFAAAESWKTSLPADLQLGDAVVQGRCGIEVGQPPVVPPDPGSGGVGASGTGTQTASSANTGAPVQSDVTTAGAGAHASIGGPIGGTSGAAPPAGSSASATGGAASSAGGGGGGRGGGGVTGGSPGSISLGGGSTGATPSGGVATVKGGAKASGSKTVLNPDGSRISQPLFSKDEVEAAIERVRQDLLAVPKK
jgi:hypothetical protein